MINPNKLYKASQIGVITKIERPDSDLGKFEVTYRAGGIYTGWVDDIKNFKRFKVGSRVKCTMQFFITSDCFKVVKMRLVRKELS